jgi:septum formation protein
MLSDLILASASAIRQTLLQSAGIAPRVVPARVDEESLLLALQAEGAKPRDIADALAEMKARKVSQKHPGSLVLGCDQVLALGNNLLMKPQSPEHAAQQLSLMQGQTHTLFSAMVLYDKAQPVWRYIGVARMTMHPMTKADISAYVAASWDDIRHCVGCYKIENGGDALFSAVEGDMTTIQGLPMPPLISYLRQRGFLTA